METIILICLLIVIALLLHDKFENTKAPSSKLPGRKKTAEIPELIGSPKPDLHQKIPKKFQNNQKDKQDEIIPVHHQVFEISEGEKEDVKNIPDFSEEEKEWADLVEPDAEIGYATGVTFEELSKMQDFLQKDQLEEKEAQFASDVVQRIEGTELFDLLENSIEGASNRIAAILDRTLSHEAIFQKRTNADKSHRDFEIDNFL